MKKQYVINQEEYDCIQAELQKAIILQDLTSKQFCLRWLAIHFDMNISGVFNNESGLV